MARLLLRMGKADEAEDMLWRCPSLKDFEVQKFLKTNNPRFSGDMVLLSKIRSAQGRYDESLNYALKTLDFRRECLEDRAKVCDSLYQVACLHEKGNDLTLAIPLLEECVEISSRIPPIEGQHHLARTSYKLFKVLQDLGKKEKSEYLERFMDLMGGIYELDGGSPHGVEHLESRFLDALFP